ncbi:hypothetical protein [Falsiroseomonas oryziterrae]|uniref:hypothetical protein n=1 Tax=Falsiroseomonas oryziterrae TaxID=2911368 RepID=UPI001F360FF4|nr:hypothetical protein [Roseomonas sp. NPKOSM-4]
MRITLLAALAAVPLLAACETPPFSDPFARPGSWQPTGVNDANIRAMAADPAHLQRGVGTQTTPATLPAAAIGRLNEGQRAPLIRETSAQGAGG